MDRIIKITVLLYIILLAFVVIYSYGFVDPNLILSKNVLYQNIHQPLMELVFNKRPLSATIFVFITLSFFAFYSLILIWLDQRKLKIKHIALFIGITTGILFFSYPAFSYDIFNYVITAKLTFLYKENPYVIMPIELLGEPNLAFTRAANKIALYGPAWIGLSFFPHLLGFGNILLTIFSFKFFMALFYIATNWIIFRMTKNIYSVALFALNPLVIIETLISSHNDIVMMFFALMSFYLLQKKKIVISVVCLLLSIFIKYATLFLLPIFIITLFRQWQKRQISWENVYHISGWSMMGIFLLSAFREEIYSWYAIWILAFSVLVPQKRLLLLLSMAFSIGTLLRYAPTLYTGSYFGQTPLLKTVLTFVPLVFVFLYIMIFSIRKFQQHKS